MNVTGEDMFELFCHNGTCVFMVMFDLNDPECDRLSHTAEERLRCPHTEMPG